MTRGARSRAAWPPSLEEARAHAVVAAVVLWIAAIGLLSTAGPRDRLGQLKGHDFVFFYTLGHLVASGQTARMYDMDAEHEVRSRVVPESATDGFASAYPPQTALLFAPYALLSFNTARIAWMATTVAIYAAAIIWLWQWSRRRLDGVLLFAGAAAFPPFWNLVLGGQSSIIPFAGLLFGWLALERGRRFTAGIAFGLFAIKPHLAVVLAIVWLWHREWRLVAGAVMSSVLQLTLASAVMGVGVLSRYAEVLQRAGEVRRLLQPHAFQVHSLQAITDLLPSPMDQVAWIAGAALLTALAVRLWGRALPLHLRLGYVMLVSVLASPHLLTYDVTLLALPLVWIGLWLQTNRTEALGWYVAMLYLLAAALILPLALLLKVQPSVLLMGVLVFWLDGWTRACGGRRMSENAI